MVAIKSEHVIKNGRVEEIASEELIRSVYKVKGKINIYNGYLKYFISRKII